MMGSFVVYFEVVHKVIVHVDLPRRLVYTVVDLVEAAFELLSFDAIGELARCVRGQLFTTGLGSPVKLSSTSHFKQWITASLSIGVLPSRCGIRPATVCRSLITTMVAWFGKGFKPGGAWMKSIGSAKSIACCSRSRLISFRRWIAKMVARLETDKRVSCPPSRSK